MIVAKKKYEYTPGYAVSPGETLKEVIESLDMTQKELALRTELTEQSIIRIIKGEQPITFETANKLEMVTNVPASMWNSLEAQFREQLEKIAQKERLQVDLEWLKLIPVKELTARGNIPSTSDKIVTLRESLKFFGVTSVKAWEVLWNEPSVAARRSTCFETRKGPASVWIRLGEIEAHGIECQPFDKAIFTKTIQNIRSLTLEDPSSFLPKMRKLCSNSGVALTIVPEMKKVPWNGATKWLSSDKAMIILNIRGKTEDKFWFSFFHEAGHILNDKKKYLYINDGSSYDEREKKADEFASDILIPPDRQNEIPLLKTRKSIIAFAKDIGVSPGIVAGQYQFRTSNWNWYNDLKRTFEYQE